MNEALKVMAAVAIQVRIALAFLLAMAALGLAACDNAPAPSGNSKAAPDPAAFSILATSDLRDAEALADMIQRATGSKVRFIFGGTMESADKVINGKADADAAWFANAKYVLSDPAGQARVKMQEKIMLSPLVIGVSQSDAQRLGWTGDAKVTWKAVAEAAQAGQLRYAMSNPASSNQGFMALMGVAAAFADKPEALTLADVRKDRVREFLAGYKLVGDNSTYLAERFIEKQGAEINAFINYESWLLSLNQSGKLREPLVLIYPHEGVATADYPLLLLNDAKRADYGKIVDYLKGAEAQRWLVEKTLRRPLNPEVARQTASLFPSNRLLVELPFTADRAVADALLDAYMNQFRTPIASVFVLDVSGSMNEAGRRQGLIDSLYFLAGSDDSITGRLARLASRERVIMLPFSTTVLPMQRFDVPSDASAKAETFAQIRRYADGLRMEGRTRLYDAALAALKLLADEKTESPGYLYSVVLFTDGQSNEGLDLAGFNQAYRQLPAAARDIPVFAILYGEGNVKELEEVARLTHGKTFDARKVRLPTVFREIRAYQ
ncbi:MAG: VWA domain-containing protein [Candidatus Contendobacter sp.]|nr:VWA domain-containing protein [Candidatus Contendobacter sp.]MDS4060673.1 VWA domain-containing protein [Candidatus Contendobacter sp.]